MKYVHIMHTYLYDDVLLATPSFICLFYPFKSQIKSRNQLLKINLIQLRGNWKNFNFQLHHRLSKFEVPVVVNLKHISELFGLYTTCFLI